MARPEFSSSLEPETAYKFIAECNDCHATFGPQTTQDKTKQAAENNYLFFLQLTHGRSCPKGNKGTNYTVTLVSETPL
jgi:hypothetical protein